jgi:pSer/pThr/pTyr-binding forkhead associated (FHA) protein
MDLNKTQLLIGRNEFCDLRITSDIVSRQHAMLFRNGSATIVVDLKSKHGTFVNGKRVTRKVLINNDIISVGDHRIKFMDPSARRRITLRGAGWDDTTIAKSITDFRNVLAKQLKSKCAS